MRTANYTDLRANLKGYIDAVVDDCDTVIINRGNGKGVVMISLDEYNSIKETEYIMSSPETMAAIRQGEEVTSCTCCRRPSTPSRSGSWSMRRWFCRS